MPYQWHTEPDGLVVVTREDGTVFVPTLTGASADAFDAGCDKWSTLAEREATRWGIRALWLLAMWRQESNFNPRAFRQEPPPRDKDGNVLLDEHGNPRRGWTGIGLGQITHPSLKGNLTDAQLMDPEVNAEVCARHVASLFKHYGDDFPRVSAAYNAGSARPDTRKPPNGWNLYCYGAHVDAEVCALNRGVLRRRADEALLRGQVLAAQFNLVDLCPEVTEHGDPAERETKPD